MSNKKSLTTDMHPKDTIKLDIAELGKSETYPEENVLPEDGLYRYLYQPRKQYGDQLLLMS